MEESASDHFSIGEMSAEQMIVEGRSPEVVLPLRQQDERQSGCLRIVVLSMLLLGLALVVYDSLGDRKIESAILEFLGWVQDHPQKGMLAVICVYILATILFVPGSVLTFGTGYAFGAAFDNKMQGVLVASTVRKRF